MQVLTIATKAELSRHEQAIAALFVDCFGRPMPPGLWRWLFLDNPHGEPVVSLCYDGDRLVGHYGAVPLPLTGPERSLNSYLSVTTMVTTSHRKHGLLVLLGTNTYQYGLGSGIDFVMGFPNAQATPGRKKRLNWTLPVPDYVATVTKDQLLDAARRHALMGPGSYRLDLNLASTRAWRLSRPGATYHWRDGVAWKDYADSVDLLAFGQAEQLEHLPGDRPINLLVHADVDALSGAKAFDYQFGGVALKTDFAPATIAREMVLSDLF